MFFPPKFKPKNWCQKYQNHPAAHSHPNKIECSRNEWAMKENIYIYHRLLSKKPNRVTFFTLFYREVLKPFVVCLYAYSFLESIQILGKVHITLLTLYWLYRVVTISAYFLHWWSKKKHWANYDTNFIWASFHFILYLLPNFWLKV